VADEAELWQDWADARLREDQGDRYGGPYSAAVCRELIDARLNYLERDVLSWHHIVRQLQRDNDTLRIAAKLVTEANRAIRQLSKAPKGRE
jgi:hypothetical protein